MNRFYRKWCHNKRLISFSVTVKETDLWIKARKRLETEAKEAIFKYRAQLEKYIKFHPEFKNAFSPLPFDPFAPQIVRQMLLAAQKAAVGPMAAVAGAIAQAVGEELQKYSEEIIIENGGDIYLRLCSPVQIGIFAGKSPLSGKVAVKIDCAENGIAVCTSSGKIGHSYSRGQADAVTIIAEDTALADAVATATGNLINTREDVENAIRWAQSIESVKGIVIIVDKYLAAWGEVDLITI